MTVITAGIASPVTASGTPATVGGVITADIADPVLVWGIPAASVPPPPTQSPNPDAISARVLDGTGAFICNLPHAKGLRWLDEHNTAGAGSIDVRRYDGLEDLHPTVWEPDNQIIISLGNVDIFRIVLDAQGGYNIDTATGDRDDTWAGTGALGVVNTGMIEPEYGFRQEATEERSFDYGSNPAIGGWYVPGEWFHPVGKLIRKSWRWTYRKRHQPKGFPDRRAQWLWWRNPDSTSTANETCYFHSSFFLSSARRVKFWVAGDDTLEFQVDGEVRITNGPGTWSKASTLVMNLSAGTHTVAAKVANTPGSVGNANRSGFICSIGRLNGAGDVAAWLLRTTPASWTMRRQRSEAPGWFSAQILRQLVQEQKDRGCAGHSGITYGFTTTTDSAGQAWTGRRELSLQVETLGLDYVQQLVETGIDVAMTPGLVLNAWKQRGTDRSGWIRLNQKGGHQTGESAVQLPSIRNFAAAKAATGWVTQTDAASVAARGRRETGIALGSSSSPAQTAASVAAMMPDLADPKQTKEVTFSGASGGPQPYTDFFVADWVGYQAAGEDTWGRYRVMSISGEVEETGLPNWTVQLYGEAS
jgi:hypothetical protein